MANRPPVTDSLAFPLVLLEFQVFVGCQRARAMLVEFYTTCFLPCISLGEMSTSAEMKRSVTLWLDELKAGSNNAASELWQRYFNRLVTLAKRQLGNAPKRIFDEEDVAIDVFHSLCQGAESGRFDKLDDRDELWKLLVVMTRHKSHNQIRHQTAAKRGGRDVRGDSVVDLVGFDQFFKEDPTPALMVQIREEQERLLGLLSEPSHREIALARLQGFSIDETAAKMGISGRSVKRKLALIREIWLEEMDDE